MVLWTNDILAAALHVYQAAGFQLAGEERHRSYGHELTGQTWRLALSGPLVSSAPWVR
jgi:hypothetical protein